MIRNITIGVLLGAFLCLGQGADSTGTGTSQPAADTGQRSQAAIKAEKKMPAQTRGQAAGVITDLLKNSKQSMLFALDEGEATDGQWDMDPDTTHPPFARLWQQKMLFRFTNEMSLRERLSLIISIECGLTFSMHQDNVFPATLAPLFSFKPYDVELKYIFGNFQNPWLQLGVGYFPFKYNPDVKNLGEYLLRSSAYPTFIVSEFERPYTRELGLHLNGFIGNPAIDQVRWDLMLTSETNMWPVLDGTVTGVVSNTLFNFFEIGGGVSFQRLFPVNESKTTPKQILSVNGRFFYENGDTGYYTFQSTKLMGRASINPQRFIPEFRIPPANIFGKNPFFGKEDLKVYGEVAILGLKDYVAYDSVLDPATGTKKWAKAPKNINYYDSLADRMPYMVGVNLPTNPIISYGILPFLLTKWLKDETGSDIRPLALITLIPGLASGVAQYYLGWNLGFDVLSFEFEWSSQRYPNDNAVAINPGQSGVSFPLPTSRMKYLLSDPQRVKYALCFKKSFTKRFAVSGLVARDHMRPAVHGSPQIMVNDDFLQTKPSWWWSMRLMANF